METQYFKDYSPALGREMECKVYGHAGRPMLFIPCQDGRFFDFEDFHMAGTLAPWIESGQIMVISIDTIDQETWSDTNGDPYWRIRRYEQWIRYIVEEVVPKIQYIAKERNGWDSLPTCGSPIFSMVVWPSAESTPQNMALAITWTRWSTRTPLWITWPTSPPITPIWTSTAAGRRSSAAVRALGSNPIPPGSSSRSLSRKTSLSGWTCGAMMSSTTGIGGISRSYIICLIFWVKPLSLAAARQLP